MKKILNSLLKSVGALSFSVVCLSANSTSIWYAHQPEVPQGLEKFKKHM